MMLLVSDDPYAVAAASAARLTSLTGRPDVAVVLGSGWAPAADAIGAVDAEVPLTELGGFPEPTVAGHTPTVRSVSAGPLRVLVFLGRVHLYEGLPPATVVHGVRTAVSAGARVVVLTNAAGGIRPGLMVGEPVLISDHLNLTGKSPLTGPDAARGVGQYHHPGARQHRRAHPVHHGGGRQPLVQVHPAEEHQDPYRSRGDRTNRRRVPRHGRGGEPAQFGQRDLGLRGADRVGGRGPARAEHHGGVVRAGQGGEAVGAGRRGSEGISGSEGIVGHEGHHRLGRGGNTRDSL